MDADNDRQDIKQSMDQKIMLDLRPTPIPTMAWLHRPDKKKDPVGWNASWEKEIKALYATMDHPSATVNRDVTNVLEMLALMPQGLEEERVTQDICDLQDELVRTTLERMSSDNFEGKWKGLTRKRREELVLEGLCSACSRGPDMETFRLWCPEMTIQTLAGNGGQGYIDMLMKFVPDDVGVDITEPTIIPHHLLERYYNLKGDGSTPHFIQKYRTYFIILTLWRILVAFYGGSDEWTVAKPLRESTSSKSGTRKTVDSGFGTDWERRMKREYKEHKINSGAVTVCWSCSKDGSKLGPGQELKVCSKCNAIGRKIWYCSSECQKHDWKNGRRPHKDICGRKVIDKPEGAKPRTKEDDQRIPPPAPGFKRSPALLHQISLLKRNPNVDYFLINPAPLDDVGITLPSFPDHGPLTRRMFLDRRSDAFRSGDRWAIRFIYRFLYKFDERAPEKVEAPKHYPLSRLKEQFEREYGGLDFSSDGIGPNEPTGDQLAMAVDQMWRVIMNEG